MNAKDFTDVEKEILKSLLKQEVTKICDILDGLNLDRKYNQDKIKEQLFPICNLAEKFGINCEKEKEYYSYYLL